MKLYDLSQTAPHRITVNCLSLLRYVHSLRELTVKGRRRSAFMLVTEGAFFYQFEEGEISLRAGDILYLPEGGHYRYQLTEGRTECLQIEAEISVDGQRAAFATHPIKLSKDIAQAQDIMTSLENGTGELEKNAAIFALLGCLLQRKQTARKVSARILPAVTYIEQSFRASFPMEIPAALCGLSQSRMRRLFREELGMSPVAYRTHLRMETACNMLRYTESNISEIAEAVGYENVFVFSRVFRAEMGCPPSAYRKQGK